MLRPAALALCAALLAACGGEDDAECPGEAVATFTFSGTKAAKGDPALATDPVPDTPDCGAGVGYEGVTAIGPFTGTLAAGPEGEAAALCTANGVVHFGQRSGEHYAVETATKGAVLAGCAPECNAELRVVVEGDVVLAEGLPAAFEGVLVEVMTPAGAGACGTCALPCAARFALAGAP